MDEIEFAEVVRVVCKHPRVNTPNGTFTEVSIFLEGYAIGAQVGGVKNRPDHSKFTPFFQWHAASISHPKSTTGWRYFESTYSDDETSLRELSRLYNEYAESVCAANVNGEDRAER